jgi:hypothetical protein
MMATSMGLLSSQVSLTMYTQTEGGTTRIIPVAGWCELQFCPEKVLHVNMVQTQ